MNYTWNRNYNDNGVQVLSHGNQTNPKMDQNNDPF